MLGRSEAGSALVYLLVAIFAHEFIELLSDPVHHYDRSWEDIQLILTGRPPNDLVALLDNLTLELPSSMKIAFRRSSGKGSAEIPRYGLRKCKSLGPWRG